MLSHEQSSEGPPELNRTYAIIETAASSVVRPVIGDQTGILYNPASSHSFGTMLRLEWRSAATSAYGIAIKRATASS